MLLIVCLIDADINVSRSFIMILMPCVLFSMLQMLLFVLARLETDELLRATARVDVHNRWRRLVRFWIDCVWWWSARAYDYLSYWRPMEYGKTFILAFLFLSWLQLAMIPEFISDETVYRFRVRLPSLVSAELVSFNTLCFIETPREITRSEWHSTGKETLLQNALI